LNWLDVRWYTFRKPDKRRPVLVLTRPNVLNAMDKVVVASISTVRRNLASEVLLTEAEGLPRPCVVSFDNLHTVDRRLLEGDDALITTLDSRLGELLRDALLASTGLR